MAEKMIKFLQFSYHVEQPSPQLPKGQNLLLERIARHLEVVDITWDYDLERGEELGAFYSDEDRKAIEEGTYRGPDAAVVYAKKQNLSPSLIEDLEGEGPSGENLGPSDIQGKSDEEVARLIVDNKLTVDQTLALTGGDKDLAELVLDAENLAANEKDADPRRGVVAGLEAQLATG